MSIQPSDSRANVVVHERRLLALPKDEIHLWLADYDQSNLSHLQDAYRRMLNDVERQQEPRFYFARDRRRYLVTRALVRAVLSRYAPVHPEDWIFSTNAYGRPEIANAEAMNQGLSFNISHTHSLIVLGISTGRAVGVDVENIRAREAAIGIADRYFAQAEVSDLTATPTHQQQYRFFEYWTFKESYIKARGMGLSLPLDKFGFHFPDQAAVAIQIHPELADEPARWQFWQFQPAPEYLVAICAERLESADARLLVRQVVPLQAEQIVATTFLRTSRNALGATPNFGESIWRIR